ncbi:MAG: type IV secretory system conjugative DNA transfer family protein, partial [Dehalococcoidia bacterium]
RQRYLLTDDEIMRLPQDKAILMMYPHKPLMLKKMDYTRHPLAKQMEIRPVTEYTPEWRKTAGGPGNGWQEGFKPASPDGFWGL